MNHTTCIAELTEILKQQGHQFTTQSLGDKTLHETDILELPFCYSTERGIYVQQKGITHAIVLLPRALLRPTRLEYHLMFGVQNPENESPNAIIALWKYPLNLTEPGQDDRNRQPYCILLSPEFTQVTQRGYSENSQIKREGEALIARAEVEMNQSLTDVMRKMSDFYLRTNKISYGLSDMGRPKPD
ncbi:MAG: hypothetical protein WC254_07425 [Candidatus Woesearchaeota archaeon]|jgi:hypothetical protein